MSEDKNVSKAAETLDHLLWEAILQSIADAERPEEVALSSSFHQKEGCVRVTYKICHATATPLDSELVFDPRLHFPHIKKLIERMIYFNLSIIKLPLVCRHFREVANLCSHLSYRHFLFEIQPPEKQLSILFWPNGGRTTMVDCDLVVIGHETLSTHIVCPCKGGHLQSTGELGGFNFTIQEPEKVGNHCYEFRFEVLPR